MKRTFCALSLVLAVLLFTSCREKQDYYYTPTIDLNVQGGSYSQQAEAPLSTGSSDEYKPYDGGAYWGDEGKSANTHYTPYSEREHNYNYYRGDSED